MGIFLVGAVVAGVVLYALGIRTPVPDSKTMSVAPAPIPVDQKTLEHITVYSEEKGKASKAVPVLLSSVFYVPPAK
jgi:hypothetical protein